MHLKLKLGSSIIDCIYSVDKDFKIYSRGNKEWALIGKRQSRSISRSKSRNAIKKQLAKANCTVNKKNTMAIRIQPWCIYIVNIF
jgi:hypothetical protein